MTHPLTNPQLDRLRAKLAAGAERAARALARDHHATAELELFDIGLCTLAEYPRGAVRDEGDLVAGAAARFDGPAAGTALLALDPEDALRWVRASGRTSDPIVRYLELAACVLTSALAPLSEEFGAGFALRAPRLVEDSVVGILLATHAPSDTLVMSARFALRWPGGESSLYLYALADAKLLARLADAA